MVCLIVWVLISTALFVVAAVSLFFFVDSILILLGLVHAYLAFLYFKTRPKCEQLRHVYGKTRTKINKTRTRSLYLSNVKLTSFFVPYRWPYEAFSLDRESIPNCDNLEFCSINNFKFIFCFSPTTCVKYEQSHYLAQSTFV